MKRILITGAGSYIGTSFEEYLKKWPDKYAVDTVDMIDGTWRDKDFSEYDVVYHVAGIAHSDSGKISEEKAKLYYSVNTDLTVETAKKAKEAGVKQFIFMSSAIVYGDSAPIGKMKMITKDTPVKPANCYGDSKVQAENGIKKLEDDSFKVVILRPPMIYGKDSKGNYPVMAKFAQKLPVFPYVKNCRSMLYIGNLMEFVRLMIENEETGTFWPQNPQYSNTSTLVKGIAKAHDKNIVLIKGFTWALKIMSHFTGVVNKAFGNLAYDKNMSSYKENYQIYSLDSSIQLTESNDKKCLYVDKNLSGERLDSLEGKRVLLIALPGYSDGIVSEMKKLGAEVDYINDKPNNGFVCKTLGRLQLGFYQKVIHKYYCEQIDRLRQKNYDRILVIRGEYTPIASLKRMKEAFPNAKIILYMWDGMNKANTKGIDKKWPFYDKVYTFDRIDYEAHKDKISFLPLYYYNEYLPKDSKKPNSDNFKYDLSFIGTGHDDRIKIVKSIMSVCKKENKKCFSYFFIPHKLVFYKYKLLNKDFADVQISDVKFKMLPFEKLYKIYADSRCVIDIENKGQHGLTMRTIELLGLKRKLITTNKDIVNYDFYNENNILIIERKNPVIDESFFEKPYVMLSDEMYEKYSLKSWIMEVLE